MRAWIVVILLFTAGTARGDTSPTDRAKAIIETQRVLMEKSGGKTFLAQLDPAAVIVSSMAVTNPKEILAALASKETDGGLVWIRGALAPLFELNHDGKQTVKASVTNVVAGGRENVVWFTFDLTIASDGMMGGKPRKTSNSFRITEVAGGAGGKVVLFHVDKAKPDEWDELPSHGGGPPTGEAFPDNADTTAPALAQLAVSPKLLGKALLNEPSTVVLGSSSTDRGVGAGAAKVVAGWANLKLEYSQSVQRLSKTWAFSVVRLTLTGKNESQVMRMFATVIALPKADGTWQVVTLRYSRLMWF